MTIRLMRKSDIPQARLLIHEGDLLHGTTNVERDIEAFNTNNSVCFVSGDDSCINGLVTASKVNDICEIRELIVAENFKRKGIGTGLMVKAKEWAKEKGVKEIRLCVLTSNKPAMSFYSKLGFINMCAIMKRGI